MDAELREQIVAWKRNQEAVDAVLAAEARRRSPAERLERALELLTWRGIYGKAPRSPNGLTPARLRWLSLKERIGGGR